MLRLSCLLEDGTCAFTCDNRLRLDKTGALIRYEDKWKRHPGDMILAGFGRPLPVDRCLEISSASGRIAVYLARGELEPLEEDAPALVEASSLVLESRGGFVYLIDADTRAYLAATNASGWCRLAGSGDGVVGFFPCLEFRPIEKRVPLQLGDRLRTSLLAKS